MKSFRFYKYIEIKDGKIEIHLNGKLVHTASDWIYAEEYMSSDLLY